MCLTHTDYSEKRIDEMFKPNLCVKIINLGESYKIKEKKKQIYK